MTTGSLEGSIAVWHLRQTCGIGKAIKATVKLLGQMVNIYL